MNEQMSITLQHIQCFWYDFDLMVKIFAKEIGKMSKAICSFCSEMERECVELISFKM